MTNTVSEPPHGTDVRRERMWSAILGAGSLSWERDGWWMRFDGDDGRVTRLNYNMLAVGPPTYVKRWDIEDCEPEPRTEEEDHWMTIGCRDGTVLGFRDSEPTGRLPDVDDGMQLDLPMDTEESR